MKQPHVCSYDSIKVVKVIADNPQYDMSKHGIWALLNRYCSCGNEKAFDYLHRKDAEEKIEALIERG